MKVTNNGTAPRGVRVGGQIKLLRPGESRDLALEGVELERAQAVKTLAFEEAAEPAEQTKGKGKGKTEAADAAE